MSFCPSCSKCPQCCPRSGCRGQTTEFLANTAKVGCKSKGGVDFEKRLHATLQNQTTSDPVPCDQEWLCSPVEKQSLIRSIGRAHKQVGGRKSRDKVLPDVLQLPFSGTKTQQKMETYSGPQPSKSVFAIGHVQNGNIGKNQVVSPKRGMGNMAGFQRRLFSHSHQSEIPEVPQLFLGRKTYQFTALPFGLATAPLEFTKVVKEVRLMAQAIQIHQYLDDWLVRAQCQETCRLHTQTLLALCRKLGWVVNMEKSEHPSTEATIHKKSENLFCQAVHVSHRAPYCNRKTSMGRSPPHETHSVASEATLACPRKFGKGYSNSPPSPSTSRLVARRGQYSQGSTLAPPSTRSANIYRRLKRRLGRTLRGVHGKRRLVRTRKPSPHQFLGVKSRSTGPQEFRASLQGSDCSDSNGQHNWRAV